MDVILMDVNQDTLVFSRSTAQLLLYQLISHSTFSVTTQLPKTSQLIPVPTELLQPPLQYSHSLAVQLLKQKLQLLEQPLPSDQLQQLFPLSALTEKYSLSTVLTESQTCLQETLLFPSQTVQIPSH